MILAELGLLKTKAKLSVCFQPEQSINAFSTYHTIIDFLSTCFPVPHTFLNSLIQPNPFMARKKKKGICPSALMRRAHF